MVYGFARQSGGQIGIYSEPGTATTVFTYLPQDHDKAKIIKAYIGSIDPNGAQIQTELIAYDKAKTRHLLDELSDELGNTDIGAADGADGLKVLQYGARIEPLITDVALANSMGRRTVADAARAIRQDLKVLLIRGYAENTAVGN